MTHRILGTGSRDWRDPNPVFDALVAGIMHVLRVATPDEIIGRTVEITVVQGCARGLDSILRGLALTIGCQVEDHPVTSADWDRHGRSAGHRRNAEMVDRSADLVLAFPLGESRGTRGCIALARSAGLETWVVEGPRR